MFINFLASCQHSRSSNRVILILQRVRLQSARLNRLTGKRANRLTNFTSPLSHVATQFPLFRRPWPKLSDPTFTREETASRM